MSQERVSGFTEKGAEPPGNLRLLIGSTVRELPGKLPKNFRGSSGNFRGSPGISEKLGGSPTPSERLAKFVSNFRRAGRSQN